MIFSREGFENGMKFGPVNINGEWKSSLNNCLYDDVTLVNQIT